MTRTIVNTQTGETSVIAVDDATLAEWRADQRTDAEKATGLVLDASDFYLALMASPLIDWSGRLATETPLAWLVRTILASGLDPSTRLAGASIAETASLFHRTDPDRPGLMEAVAAILPRADARPGGLTSAEIDALFLAVAG